MEITVVGADLDEVTQLFTPSFSVIFPSKWMEILEANVADVLFARARGREWTAAGGAKNAGCGCVILEFQTPTASYSGTKTCEKSKKHTHMHTYTNL